MKLIVVDDNNYNQDDIYNAIDNFLHFGYDYLPLIFAKKRKTNGIEVLMPRWITKREYDNLGSKEKKLADELNWE